MAAAEAQTGGEPLQELDALVVGAGVGGMYALHRLREMGLSVRVFDGADGIGGTWWWNRYPGARVDFPSAPFYCYTFSEELFREWDWAERQPAQAEVLAYLEYMADKFDLRRDIQLNTWVTGANFDEAAQRWIVKTGDGQMVSAQFLVCAMGTLSAANKPDIPGIDDFAGEIHHTGQWPQQGVTFEGKRVGVIGTGSSGVQAIPIIARESAHLTVFQRTPQYSIPAGNRPVDPEYLRETRENWHQYRARMLEAPAGMPYELAQLSAHDHTPEQRREVYEALWQDGGLFMLFNSYSDLLTDKEANATISSFVRSKIKEIVRDPETARKLMPDYMLGTKRQILDDGYYDTFNRDNVTLVDLREDPITRVTADGIRTTTGDHPLDMLVLATGYDALTGALLRVNPQGRDGVTLQQKWQERFSTYLGVTIPGFPNLFMVHGPESPSVLFNMPLGAEQEGNWIRDCIRHMREQGLGTIEPAAGVEDKWRENVAFYANQTLFPLTESWYTGANIEGKHRQFAVHLGGPEYFQQLTDEAQKGYPSFVLEKESRSAAAG
jgi:cation diffusion facilitator CzcD-associated flavoprotein CzcO